MGAPFWTPEENKYFLEEIVPISKYAKGYFTPDEGLNFGDLASMMQEAMASKGINKRKYTEEIMFQHWYQKINVRVRPGSSTSSSYASCPTVSACNPNEGSREPPSTPTKPVEGEVPATGETPSRKNSSTARSVSLSSAAAKTAKTTSSIAESLGTMMNGTPSVEIQPPSGTNPDEPAKSSAKKRPHQDTSGSDGKERTIKRVAKKLKAVGTTARDESALSFDKTRDLGDVEESNTVEPSTKKQKATSIQHRPKSDPARKEPSRADDRFEIMTPPTSTNMLYQEKLQRHRHLPYSSTYTEQPPRLPYPSAPHSFQPTQTIPVTSMSPNNFYPLRPQVPGGASHQGEYLSIYSAIQPRLGGIGATTTSSPLPSREDFERPDGPPEINHSPYQPPNTFTNHQAPSGYYPPRCYDDAIQQNFPYGPPHTSSAFPLDYPLPHYNLVGNEPSRPGSPSRSLKSHPAPVPVRPAQGYSLLHNNPPPGSRQGAPPSTSSGQNHPSPKPDTDLQTSSPRKGIVRLAGGLMVMMPECPCCDRKF